MILFAISHAQEIEMDQFNNNQAWEAKFAELVAYREEYGHCSVPRTYEANRELGHWVMRQRTQYRLLMEGKRSSMTEERIVTLNQIGFVWDTSHLGAWQLNPNEG